MILMSMMTNSYTLDPALILATVLILGIAPVPDIEGQLMGARLTGARLMGVRLMGVRVMEVPLILPLLQQDILRHLILGHMPVLSREVSLVRACKFQCLAQFMDHRLESRWSQALPMVVA